MSLKKTEYIREHDFLRLTLDDFIRELTDPSRANGFELSMAKAPASERVSSPVSVEFLGLDVIPKRPTHAPPDPANARPENWWWSRYNQPFEIPVYCVKNARILEGDFRDRYFCGDVLDGMRLAFHKGTGLLLMQEGKIFEGSFAWQDHLRTLPDSFFSFENGCVVAQSSLDLERPARRINELCYYLGPLLRHWGHFLLDGMPRLWFLRYIPESIRRSMKFICLGATIPQWGWDLLAPFGINQGNLVFSQEDLLIDNLIVPESSYRTHVAGHGEFQMVADVICDYYAKDVTAERRIYLSRRGQEARRLENEHDIESLMSRNGFEIITPERLSVADQIRLAASANVLAGCTGSGMYLAMFQKRHSTTAIFSPKNFLLFDDFALAAIGQRKCHFMLGGDHQQTDQSNRRKSVWTMPIDDGLRAAVAAL